MRRLLFVALAAALLITGCAEELSKPGAGVEGYERVVLAELFTATWCGNCPKAEAGLDQLFAEEGPGKIAVIHWHPTELADPFGLPITDERWSAYKASLDTLNEANFPTCIFGGVDMVVGAATVPIDEYRNSYEHERAVGSHLELSLALEVAEDEVTVGVGIESDSAAVEELALWVVLVEHEVSRPGAEEMFSFVARAVEVTAVEIEAYGEQHKQIALPIDETWDRDKLHVVAFLQPEDLGVVRQAAMQSLSFRSFELSAADTTFTGEEAPRSFTMPFTIENTGTLRDSLELDLPAASLDLPAGWTAELQKGAVIHAAPMTLALDPGEMADSLQVLITTAGTAGKGQVGLIVRSLLEAGFDQALTFRFQYGSFSFTAAGPEDRIHIQSGQPAFAPLTLQNTGSEDLEIVVDLPEDQPDLPSGWSVALATAEGAVLDSPDTVGVAAGEETDDIGVEVTAVNPGIGSVRVLVSSPQTIAEPQEITIDLQSGEVAFTATPQDTTVVIETFVVAAIRCRFNLTGSIPSPIHAEVRTPDMPVEWGAVLCDDSSCYGTSYTIPIGDLDWGIELHFTPTSLRCGTAEIYFSSPLDPSVRDTVLVHYEPASGCGDRTVLAELFTSIFCPNCPEAEAALDSLYQDELSTGKLAVIHWHTLSSPIPDPFYGLAHADSLHDILDARQAGALGEPHCVFDGDDGIPGGSATTYDQYRARFNEAVAVPSPADLTVTLDATTARIIVTTEVAMDEGASFSDVELKVVLLEDDAYKSPAPHGPQDFVARAYSRRIISVGAGQTQSYQTGEIALDPTWAYQRLFVVAMVREQEFGEVHQSVMIPVPFGALAGR